MLLLQATHCLVSTLLCPYESVLVRHSELEVTTSFACAPPTVLSMDAQRCVIKESTKKRNLQSAPGSQAPDHTPTAGTIDAV